MIVFMTKRTHRGKVGRENKRQTSTKTTSAISRTMMNKMFQASDMFIQKKSGVGFVRH